MEKLRKMDLILNYNIIKLIVIEDNKWNYIINNKNSSIWYQNIIILICLQPRNGIHAQSIYQILYFYKKDILNNGYSIPLK